MGATTGGTFATSDGCNMSYTVRPLPAAGAPCVALIHSLALDRSIWNGVVARLAGRHITPAECPQDIARELKKLLQA